MFGTQGLTHMGSIEQQTSGQQKLEYMTKKVSLNGQLVTLYSLNGQTWLSSPEEIPEMMARLDNARITLNSEGQEGADLSKEEEGTADEKKSADKKADDKKAADKAQPTAPVVQGASKYRIKGPKPRPILRQNGMIFKGTSIEPFSASDVQVKPAPIKAPQKNVKGAAAKVKVKLKAPVLSEARAAAKAAIAAKKVKQPNSKQVLAPIVQKGAKERPAAVAAKATKASLPVGAKAKGSALISREAKAPVKRPVVGTKKQAAAKPKVKAAKPAAKKGKGAPKRR